MLSKKSFQTKISEANAVFTVTVEKLKSVKAEIAEKITTNNSDIDKLKQENTELETLSANATKQIDEIGKFLN